jgi:hypothetical protein
MLWIGVSLLVLYCRMLRAVFKKSVSAYFMAVAVDK